MDSKYEDDDDEEEGKEKEDEDEEGKTGGVRYCFASRRNCRRERKGVDDDNDVEEDIENSKDDENQHRSPSDSEVSEGLLLGRTCCYARRITVTGYGVSYDRALVTMRVQQTPIHYMQSIIPASRTIKNRLQGLQ